MNIGSVANQTGVSAKTIRYYESIGLIPKPARQDNGYRAYSENDVRTLAFVRRARTMGFSVDEVEDLLALWRDTGRASADVKKMTLRRIGEIDERIAQLKTMRDTLHHLAECCQGDDRPDCPILEDFGSNDG